MMSPALEKSDYRDFDLVLFLPIATATQLKQPRVAVQKSPKLEKEGGGFQLFFMDLEPKGG
jgi:hypothetical protein